MSAAARRSYSAPERYLEGLLAILVWLGWTEVYGMVTVPVVATYLVLAGVVLMSADATSDRPLLSRLAFAASTPWTTSITGALLVLLFVFTAVHALSEPVPTTDQPVTLLCAAQDVREGVVPYTTYEPQCYRQVGYKLLNATPLEAGPFGSYTHYPSPRAQLAVLRLDQERGAHAGFPAFGYPPDAALVLFPVAFTSWSFVSWWVALLCAALLMITWRPRVPGRWWLVSWQLGGLALPLLYFGWNPELVSYLLLALAFAVSYWPRRSGIAMAVAVCTNPLAWVAAPVYLAVTSRYPQFRRRVAWLTGAVVVGVVPWLVWDHSLVQQIWRFLMMPTFPIGAALGRFAQLPSHGHAVYFVAFVSAIVAATVGALRLRQWRWGFAVAVYLAFMVSWRGPVYYYVAAFWLAPAVVAGQSRYVLAGQAEICENGGGASAVAAR